MKKEQWAQVLREFGGLCIFCGSAAYLSHWLEVLRQDKRAIFSAAAHAQRAVDYLHGLQVAPAQAA